MQGTTLITGSSGTIGTRLCEYFLNNNKIFLGLDLKPNKWSKEINDLTIISDLRQKTFFDELPKDIDTVIHLAANSRVHDLIKNPTLALDNFITLSNILEYVRINKIRRFLFASSREVYGSLSKDKAREIAIDLNLCENPYSASKLGGEALIQSYSKCFNIDFLILRFSNVYGMYDESDRVIPLFLKLCKSKKDISVFGKDKIIDFVHIDDIINAIMRGIEKFDTVKNDVFNIAYGKGTSLVDLARLIKSSMGAKINVRVGQNRTGDVMKFVGDITKATENLGYIPEISIEEGIIKTIAWYSVN